MPDKTLGEQSYEQFADRYAAAVPTKPHNAHYDRPATLSLIPDDLTGQRVLDAGCGPGEYTATLLDRGAAVVACDVTPAFVTHTRQRFGGRVDLYHHDLHAPLHFLADASVQGVVCALVMDYLDDWPAVLGEFARVLTPGGFLVLSTGHPASDWRYKQRVAPDDPDASYFRTERFAAAWGGFGDPKPVVTCYRRPLMDTLNPLLDAGLILDRVLEPRPTPAFHAADPAHATDLDREPIFLMLRAIKPPA